MARRRQLRYEIDAVRASEIVDILVGFGMIGIMIGRKLFCNLDKGTIDVRCALSVYQLSTGTPLSESTWSAHDDFFFFFFFLSHGPLVLSVALIARR